VPSWQADLRSMLPPPWFPSSGWAEPVSASDPLPVAIAVSVELYDAVMLPGGAPGGSAASISYARALLSAFYDRLHWLVSSNQNSVGADEASHTPLPSTPTMRVWTPLNLTRTAYVSITKVSSLATSEVSTQLRALNDHDVKECPHLSCALPGFGQSILETRPLLRWYTSRRRHLRARSCCGQS
jgi:hypothetical protein